MDISQKGKDILNFKPRIQFIEPEQEDVPIEAIEEDQTPQEIKERKLKIKNLADSVITLAIAVQSKIDKKSKDQITILDSKIDSAVIQALRRSYPKDAPFNKITYAQYKSCKDRLRDYAQRASLKAVITADDINKAKSQMSQGKFTIGGIGTEEASNGGLRPELNNRNQIIEPLDMDALQLELTKTLTNTIWDMSFYNILGKIPLAKSVLPEKIFPLSGSGQQMAGDLRKHLEEQLLDGSAGSGLSQGVLDIANSVGGIKTKNILNPVQFQDCNIIVKIYEKGCHASMTEASVFAPFTSQLDFTRNMASTISRQMGSNTGDADKETLKDKSLNPLNFASGSSSVDLEEMEEEKGLFGKIGENFFPGGDSLGGLLNSECIPCGFRLNFKNELDLKASLEPIGQYLLNMMEDWLNNALSQIRNLIDMFSNLDQYLEICSFIKFFQDFVCIPDLARILAMLAALMMDLSFELNAIIDFALSLIVPLFLPFLTELLDTLIKYILMIVKPIECIIDSIQDMLGKLDYNVLFQNIPPVANILKPTATADTKIKIPILGDLIPGATISGTSPLPSISVDLAPARRAQREREQAAIDKAYENLQKLKKAAAGVDASDPGAYEKYKKQEQQAREEYKDALQERDLSEIGEANLAIEKFQSQMKGMMFQLISYMREAVLKVEAFVNGIFEEFKKMLKLYAGGNGKYINFGAKKLAIVQMIVLIKSIIEFLTQDLGCDEGQETGAVLDILAKQSGFKVFTDKDGNIFIEEGLMADASEDIQSLDLLLDYTGDKVLDTKLIDTAKKLTIPNKLKINCSLITSKDSAENVNKWVEELNGE